MSRPYDLIGIWEAALEIDPRPEDAMALLADAIALGLNEGDFNPEDICARIRESFEQLHRAKYLGRQQ